MRRRAFFSLSAVPLALPAVSVAQRRAAHAVAIESLEVFQVKVNHRGNWVIARVKASNGLKGLGDASHGRDSDVVRLMHAFFGRIRGGSIFDVEVYRRSLWPEISRHQRSGAVAFSALEQALHDLQGQTLEAPCWALFGGKIHPRIRHYANINRCTVDRTPEGFGASATRATAEGFDAIKMAPFDGMPKSGASEIAAHTEAGIHAVTAVRKVIGPDRDLLVDGHSHFDRARGLDLVKRLTPVNLFWLEEVCRAVEDLAAINEAAPMPTAGGESIFGVQGFLPYINAGAVDITMPDVKYAGGMLELKKIAAVSEAAALLCSPHGPASPVGNFAAAHVCAGMPNFQILELGFGEVPWRADLVEPPEVYERGGYLTVPDRPGLGIRLNERVAAEHAVS